MKYVKIKCDPNIFIVVVVEDDDVMSGSLIHPAPGAGETRIRPGMCSSAPGADGPEQDDPGEPGQEFLERSRGYQGMHDLRV